MAAVVGGVAPRDPSEEIHKIALRYGLPEIPGHYGYDFSAHEFIRVPTVTIAPPRAPAHARVLALLGDAHLTVEEDKYRRAYSCIVLEPRSEENLKELLEALKEYRASLVTNDTRERAEAAVTAARAASEAMEAALKNLPDDMRKTVKETLWPRGY